MSLVFVIVILLPILLGVFFGVRYRMAGSAVTEPSCGKCGYSVRGLPGMICPECGGDFREVGIRTPGTTPPLSTRAKLIVWTLIVPLPGLLLGTIFGSTTGPRPMVTTQRRTVFLQTGYANGAVQIAREGRKLTWGRVNMSQVVPPETMTLSWNGIARSAMQVALSDGKFSYTNAASQAVTGAFDAAGITRWLNDLGMTDPQISDRAADIAAAVAEMDTAAGSRITQFTRDPRRGHLVTAHPTFTFTRPESTWLSVLPPAAMTLLIWLAGLPFILRGRRYRRGR